MAFEKTQIEMMLVTRPKFLNDPSTGIFKDLSRYLFKYSYILDAFPFSFEIEGVKPTGRILDDGSVYTDCLVSFTSFKCSPGDILHASDGYVCAVFHSIVDGSDSFTGDFRVTSIENDKILGTSSNVEEDSDF